MKGGEKVRVTIKGNAEEIAALFFLASGRQKVTDPTLVDKLRQAEDISDIVHREFSRFCNPNPHPLHHGRGYGRGEPPEAEGGDGMKGGEKKSRAGRDIWKYIRLAVYTLWFAVGTYCANKIASSETLNEKIDALAAIIYDCFFLGLAMLAALDRLLYRQTRQSEREPRNKAQG